MQQHTLEEFAEITSPMVLVYELERFTLLGYWTYWACVKGKGEIIRREKRRAETEEDSSQNHLWLSWL